MRFSVNLRACLVLSVLAVSNAAVLTSLTSDQSVVMSYSGLFLTSVSSTLTATAYSSRAATTYQLTAMNGGGFSIQDTTSRQFVTMNGDSSSVLQANRWSPQGWEQFNFVYKGSNNWVIQSTTNNNYLAANANKQFVASASAATAAVFTIQTPDVNAAPPTNGPGFCRVLWGSFQNYPWANQLGLTTAYGNSIHHNSDIVHFYGNWDDGTGDFTNSGTLQSWIPAAVNLQADYRPARSHIPMLTWQAWKSPYSSTNNYYSYTDIAAGKFDTYLKNSAAQIKKWNFDILLRPFHEFDGDWYPWGNKNGNTPDQFIAAWKRIIGIFQSLGVTNAKFVWCPNHSNGGNVMFEKYYPGDGVVDYVCLDVYSQNTDWSFSQMVGANASPPNPYARMVALTNKPMIIAETGVAGVGSRQKTVGQWFADLGNNITSTMPQITAVMHFNSGSYAINQNDGTLLASFRGMFDSCP